MKHAYNAKILSFKTLFLIVQLGYNFSYSCTSHKNRASLTNLQMFINRIEIDFTTIETTE